MSATRAFTGPHDADRPIGVFDSGVGGLSILRALRREMPGERFVYYADSAHAPYGERPGTFVADRSMAVAGELVHDHAIKALVVACNTATAAAIDLLRARLPDLPVVGVEPALKPAVRHSKTKRIVVLATRGTLASAKFRALHDSCSDQAEFVMQPCDGLAAAIEAGDDEAVRTLSERYACAAGPYGTRMGEADTIVLGCTHYAFAADHLAAAAGSPVRLIETGAPVSAQARRLLHDRNALRPGGEGRVVYASSGSGEALLQAARRWSI